ncbi:MAG: hypothetical protein JWO45_680, partial [Spartobacteria bacterium]|nr:hypothetical protein [Spartobacteria bacterium]
MTDAVTIISPELRPGKGGVGDHTLRLLEAWRSTGSFKVVVPLQGLEVNPSLSIPIEPLAAEATDVVRQLPRRGGSVLVQYSAYGFDSRGYPHRLIQTLLDWKKHNSG